MVSLLDIFPTLLDLAGLPLKEALDGRSLAPLLADPAAEWDHAAITTYDFSEFSVRDERWRYIRYIDGTEELYDHEADPEEWHNLADDPAFRSVIDRLAARIPEDPAPLAQTSYRISPHHVPPFRSYEHWNEWKREQAEGAAGADARQ